MYENMEPQERQRFNFFLCNLFDSPFGDVNPFRISDESIEALYDDIRNKLR